MLRRLSLLSILFTFFLAGCAGDVADLERYVEETKLKYRGSVAPLPQFEPYQNFEYDPTELRDPFITEVIIPEEAAPSTGGPTPDQQRRKEPLEYFPLDTLRMVGILEQNSVSWGLIKAPDGTIHRVREGNYVGENYGQITRVTEEKISLLEIVTDGLGAWIEREAALAIGEL